jgi:hypothetical protein
MSGSFTVEKMPVRRQILMAVFLSVAFVTVRAQTSAAGSPTAGSGKEVKGAAMTHATGSFTVKLDPQKDEPADGKVARMTIDKQFSGDLEGASRGQMLSAGTEVKGSAGYVAIEKVTGTLSGRSGSFILQHSATMDRGVPQLSITVVPDSGTGELTGIRGSMQIIIKDGKHSYDFEYTIQP